MADVSGGCAAAAAGGSPEQGEVPHAGALADGSIGEAHPEDLDPAVGARPRVVAVVAAVRAPPRHPHRRRGVTAPAPRVFVRACVRAYEERWEPKEA